MYQSFLFLKKSRIFDSSKQNVPVATATDPKIYILIPVLREQEIIIKNLEIFTKLNGQYEVVYITTEKEKYEKGIGLENLISFKKRLLGTDTQEAFIELLVGLFPQSMCRILFNNRKKEGFWSDLLFQYKQLLSTGEMIDFFIKNSTKNLDFVKHIHYPKTDGLMSHQLNYACERIAAENKPDECFILIYNADSEVQPNILDEFRLKIEQGEKVIMQSALFLSNYNSFEKGFRQSILRSVGLVQSRWTLAHEIPRIRRQYNQGVLSNLESAHVVGHGACIRLDTLQKAGGYPTEFLNEDLPLGYFLALAGEKVCPLSILENAESPTSISSVITQYTTWFFGVAGYYSYYKHAVRYLSLPKHKACLWAGINALKALLWLLTLVVWIILILAPLFLGIESFTLIAAGIFVFFTAGSNLIVASFVESNPQILGVDSFQSKYTFDMILTAPIAYLMRSFGPVRGFYQICRSYITQSAIVKKKTER